MAEEKKNGKPDAVSKIEKDLWDEIDVVYKAVPRRLKDAEWDLGAMKRMLTVGLYTDRQRQEMHVAEAASALGKMQGMAESFTNAVKTTLTAKKRSTSDVTSLRATAQDVGLQFDAFAEIIRTSKTRLQTAVYGPLPGSAS